MQASPTHLEVTKRNPAQLPGKWRDAGQSNPQEHDGTNTTPTHWAVIARKPAQHKGTMVSRPVELTGKWRDVGQRNEPGIHGMRIGPSRRSATKRPTSTTHRATTERKTAQPIPVRWNVDRPISLGCGTHTRPTYEDVTERIPAQFTGERRNPQPAQLTGK